MSARRVLAAVTAALAVGCCTPEIRYQRVEVPVPVACPPPPTFPAVDLPSRHIPSKPTDPAFVDAWRGEVVKRWAESVTILLRELAVRDRILDGYRQNPPMSGVPK